jgi:hypothetical protein
MIFLACAHLVYFTFLFRTITSEMFESNKISIENASLDSSPKIVWLMSFPNSGTSFTTDMIRRSTNQYTATNYGEEHIDQEGFSVPLRKQDQMYEFGPFLSEKFTNQPEKRHLGKYVLTKTHCGGRCSRCAPLDYIESKDSFKTDCLTARRGFSDESGKLSFAKNQYDEKLVQKAIHLMRNPFNNIVSRFHLTHKVNARMIGDTNFQTSFPNDEQGFRKWCNVMDKKYAADESIMFKPSIVELFEQVPCHADFYRYVMWHNLAFETVDSLGIPSISVHYEDYEHDFDGTKAEIITFLETEEVSSSSSDENEALFVAGKSYGHFFTRDERNAIKNLIYELSSIETRNEVRRYFIDDY